MMPAEFLGRVTSRELSWLAAHERVAGPQGSDRDDWRFAWLALWIVRAAGVKELEAKWLYTDLIMTLRDVMKPSDDDEPDVFIDDDPELMEAHREKVEAAIFARFGRPPDSVTQQGPDQGEDQDNQEQNKTSS